MKLWGGRFARGGRDPLFEKFCESFSLDQRLVHYDLSALWTSDWSTTTSRSIRPT